MIEFSDAVISDRLQALTRALDAGTAGGTLNLYKGTRPARGTSAGDNLLATFTFADPSLNNVTGNALTLNTPPAATCVGTGIAIWARMLGGDGTFIADMDIGLDGSGKEVIIDQLQLYTGGEVTATVGTLTEV